MKQKGVTMKCRHLILAVLLFGVFMFSFQALSAAETVEFKPVRTPSVGPEGASVTVYEIADFM